MGVGVLHHAPATLPPGKTHSTHCIRGYVDPRAGLEQCGKSRPYRDSNPGPSLFRLSYPGPQEDKGLNERRNDVDTCTIFKNGCRTVRRERNCECCDTSKDAYESENWNSSWKSECNTIQRWEERLVGEQMGLNWCRNSWQRLGGWGWGWEEQR